MNNRRGHRKENRYTENTTVNNKPYISPQHEDPLPNFLPAHGAANRSKI